MNSTLVSKKIICLFITVLSVSFVFAQKTLKTADGSAPTVTYDSQGRPIKKQASNDSLQHRDKYADSITIFYRYYDSTRNRILDSSINDFTARFPQPYWVNNLGNLGTATHSMIFSPILKSGWDAGFHQFDATNLTIEGARFFQTTRPYTELAYMLGSKAEQLVNFIHTQNRNPRFNFGIEYRFANSPGLYRLQNASFNNVRFTAHYQTANKRYESFFIFLSTKNAASENGGLQDIHQLNSLTLGDPFVALTRLGIAGTQSRNPFNTTVNTGNIYQTSTILYRHQYDFGQKDSLVTDSSVIKLFYARLRLQHTLSISTNTYNFKDINADSTAYQTYFNYHLTPYASGYLDTVSFKDKWSIVNNEFSVISFPEKNNQSQFLKVGAALQNLKGTFNDTVTHNFYNIYALAEYRNRTRNQVWDIEAVGNLYLNGMNAGDYNAFISLKRKLSKAAGNLQIGFQNVNRTVSFIFNPLTAFPINNKQNFNKENTTKLFAVYENPKLSFKLSGEYFLISNYAYMDSFFTARQEAGLFNVLHISAEKKFKLNKYFNWYSEVHLQQTTGGIVHVPTLLTRNRVAFEGNFYKNLFLSTGIEIRYYTNYQADNYSPFTGQFFYQSGYTTSNRPDVNLFFNFRIKGFKAFVRAENLNTLVPTKGVELTKYNITPQLYPQPTFWFRFGVWWSFVN
ncbi:MAG: hypothetical protein JST29_03655 [Bacteroidetes bacterium]|nr:hypothetical protein [Bacteroidota bacterium]